MTFRCRSREGAWIEILLPLTKLSLSIVAPARERGLKYDDETMLYHYPEGRSREGAWIEIRLAYPQPYLQIVAPARERGLKY